MKMRTRQLLWLLGGIASAAALDACAQGSAKVCDDIAIDSAGVHSFNHSRVEAVATSHGLKGIADFVLIVPPPTGAPREASDIKQLIVMADVRPMPEAKCAKFVDPEGALVNCAQSIPSQGLKVIVKFKGDEPAKYQERMPSLMSYVAHEALCSRPVVKKSN
jgi:hypothetical protein